MTTPSVMRYLLAGWFSWLFVQGQHQTALMTYEEYARTRHPVPYVVTLRTSGGGLLYFGARHCYDPSHPQNVEIEKQWQAFRPEVAFNEGGDPPAEKTAALSVARHGEAGLVRFLAQRDRIAIHSLEPDLEEEVVHLLSGFSCEQLKLFYALRQVDVVRKSGHARSIDEEMNGVLMRLSRVPSLDCFPKTLRELEVSYRKLLGARNWREVPAEWFDPIATHDGTFLNEVTRASSRFRDEHMIGLLVAEVKQGKRVFAVVGATHVVIQERGLRASLQAN